MAAQRPGKKNVASPANIKSKVFLDLREYIAADTKYLSEVIYSAIPDGPHKDEPHKDLLYAFAPVPEASKKLSKDYSYAFVTKSNNKFVPGVNVLDGCDGVSQDLRVVNRSMGADPFGGLRTIQFKLNLPGLDMPGFLVYTADPITKEPFSSDDILKDICYSVKAYITAIKDQYAADKMPYLVQYENTPFYLDTKLINRYWWDFRTIDLSTLYLLGALKDAESKSFVLILGISR
ncbi:hypothetical protein JR316_0006549 [Psilocybe cubensis]|uniref:Uncharacterized protein n=2 Tax=Psilocybe cubensis TaxID=181762 RepID=A0A8H7XL03_PSICU|nr:hypothetical protein JR316_0006549 [Psilocybe cubensis]KAH9482019.1 hypothetical protein JR316_0006549 [Psilocybe cubensis]